MGNRRDAFSVEVPAMKRIPSGRHKCTTASVTPDATTTMSATKTSTATRAENVVIIIDDDDDDDDDGAKALPSLHPRLPRSPLLAQQNTPSSSHAHHVNRIDLTSPQFNVPTSHAWLLKADERKHIKIDLTSPRHLRKDGLRRKQKKAITEKTTKVQNELSLMCPICMEKMREETSTSCGHIFCKSCITQSLLHQKKCPTCRKNLNTNKIHRIYLSGSTL